MTPTSTSPATQELLELEEFVESSSLSSTDRERLREILARLNRRIVARNQTMLFVKSVLSELRFDADLMKFDLQATRCERDDYRKELQKLRRKSGE